MPSAPTVAAAASTPPPVETEMAEPSAKAVLPIASPPVAATLEPYTAVLGHVRQPGTVSPLGSAFDHITG